MKTYLNHLMSTGAHGFKPAPSRKPVLKSSAIFPCVVQEGLDTCVLYMGYWLLKRSIPEVSLLRTLRDQVGTIVARELQVIDDVRAYELSVAEMLRTIDYDSDSFIGSIELEIFSTRDLVFPYPAFVLNYRSTAASTVVHTTGRVYNDLEDLAENEAIPVPEAGFDIDPRRELRPYFAFVNGASPMTGVELQLTLVNSRQERRNKELALGDLVPYQSCFVDFIDENDRMFLEGARGTVIIHHKLSGFFPRFIAGHICDDSFISLTHTFYDTTGHDDAPAYWSNADPERYEDSTVAFPVRIGGDWFTELVIYPNHAPIRISLDLVLCSPNGDRLARVNNVMDIDDGKSVLAHLDIGKLFPGHADNRKEGDLSAMAIIRSGGKVPARMKFGLNIGQRSGYQVPSNICFNARVPNPSMLDKPRAFRWAPLDVTSSTVFVLLNYSFERVYDRPAVATLRFWRQEDQCCLERKVAIAAEGSYWLHLDQDPELKSFFGDASGWVTCEADNPFVGGWYIFSSGHGVIGADHAF